MRINKHLINGIQGTVYFWLALNLAGCSTTSNQQNLVLEELKGIHSSLEVITEKLSEQEASRQKLISFSSKFGSSTGREVNVDKLIDITLPNNPTSEDVKKYIQKIRTASIGQRGYSARDPQVALYAEVGQKNLPHLIDSLSRGDSHTMHDYHIIFAITQLVDDAHKSLILDSLSRHPSLVKVVLEKGWEVDAREILLTELKTEQRLSTDWVKATAMLNDPESYPFLRDHFIKAGNRSQTYDAIKNLPLEDMTGAVAEAWEGSQYEHEYERQRMAVIAVEYGRVDALGFLVDALITPPDSNASNYMRKEMRFALLKTTDFRGSNEEFKEWFETNQDHLRFDQESKIFVISQEVE